MWPGGFPADTYHNSNQPFPAPHAHPIIATYSANIRSLVKAVFGEKKLSAAPILHKISNLFWLQSCMFDSLVVSV